MYYVSKLLHIYTKNNFQPTKLTTNRRGAAAPLVFFMIGCQRSGSNWLRTILGEREDLIAP
jgi:hypothetical protein